MGGWKDGWMSVLFFSFSISSVAGWNAVRSPSILKAAAKQRATVRNCLRQAAARKRLRLSRRWKDGSVLVFRLSSVATREHHRRLSTAQAALLVAA